MYTTIMYTQFYQPDQPPPPFGVLLLRNGSNTYLEVFPSFHLTCLLVGAKSVAGSQVKKFGPLSYSSSVSPSFPSPSWGADCQPTPRISSPRNTRKSPFVFLPSTGPLDMTLLRLSSTRFRPAPSDKRGDQVVRIWSPPVKSPALRPSSVEGFPSGVLHELVPGRPDPLSLDLEGQH